MATRNTGLTDAQQRGQYHAISIHPPALVDYPEATKHPVHAAKTPSKPKAMATKKTNTNNSASKKLAVSTKTSHKDRKKTDEPESDDSDDLSQKVRQAIAQSRRTSGGKRKMVVLDVGSDGEYDDDDDDCSIWSMCYRVVCCCIPCLETMWPCLCCFVFIAIICVTSAAVLTPVFTFFVDLWNDIMIPVHWVEDAVSTLENAMGTVKDIIGDVESAVENVADEVESVVTEAVGEIEGFVDTAVDTITGAVGAVESAVEGVASSIENAVEDAIDDLGDDLDPF